MRRLVCLEKVIVDVNLLYDPEYSVTELYKSIIQFQSGMVDHRAI